MALMEPFRVFVSVYRSGSVSRAARELHLTQPAVSAALSALEDRVGEALFTRTPRGMTPTERGKLLYAGVADSVDRLMDAARALRAQGPQPGTPLRVGTTPEFLHGFVLERLGTDLTLNVTFGDDRALLDAVEGGTLDAALLNVPPPGRALTEWPLMDAPFVLIGPPSWELPVGEVGAWLNARPWVSYSVELPITRRFFAGTLGVRFAARQVLVAPDLRAVVRAVEVGLGASLVPLFAAGGALETSRVHEVWPVRTLIPSGRWRLILRVPDEGRADLRALADRLRQP